MMQSEEQVMTSNSTQEMYIKAQDLYLVNRQYSLSLYWVGKVLEIDKNHKEALTLKAKCLSKLERYEEDIISTNVALEIDPSYLDALYILILQLEHQFSQNDMMISLNLQIKFQRKILHLNQHLNANLKAYRCQSDIKISFNQQIEFQKKTLHLNQHLKKNFKLTSIRQTFRIFLNRQNAASTIQLQQSLELRLLYKFKGALFAQDQYNETQYFKSIFTNDLLDIMNVSP